ncbi:hypothetical protein DFH29DRAFT_158436 [Suillus ampliporus]|nr:hypothetical protein DFH29DRAFT_158436 [Suillus ampliporus]
MASWRSVLVLVLGITLSIYIAFGIRVITVLRLIWLFVRCFRLDTRRFTFTFPVLDFLVLDFLLFDLFFETIRKSRVLLERVGIDLYVCSWSTRHVGHTAETHKARRV